MVSSRRAASDSELRSSTVVIHLGSATQLQCESTAERNFSLKLDWKIKGRIR